MNSWGFERQVEMRCRAGRPLPLAQIRIVEDSFLAQRSDGGGGRRLCGSGVNGTARPDCDSDFAG